MSAAEPGERREEPLARPAARALVFDAEGRLLLLRTSLGPDPAFGYYWMAPGGRLEPGESPREGAARELREETGLDAPIGPLAWVREFTWRFSGTERHPPAWFATVEHFYVVRLAERAPAVRLPGGEEEMVHLGAARWWSVDELVATAEPLSPLALADLVPPLARGEIPDPPLRIGR